MAKNKRTPIQRKLDVACIIQWLVECSSLSQIHERLNNERKGKYQLSKVQVHLDIQTAVAEVVQRNAFNTVEERRIMAERQINIAREALRCHGLSLRDQETFISEKLEERPQGDFGEDNKRAKLITKRHKTRSQKSASAGDKGYLAIASNALAEYSRLLGLYVQPPKDQLPEIPAGGITNNFVFAVQVTGPTPPTDPLDNVRTINDRSSPPGAGQDKATQATGGSIVVKPSSATVEGLHNQRD